MKTNAQLRFEHLMEARTKLVQTECSKRTHQPAVNSNAMYALEVGILELEGIILCFSVQISGVVPGVQDHGHQLDAQPAAAVREGSGGDREDH